MKSEELQEFKELLRKRVRELLEGIGGYNAGIKEIKQVRSADWVDKVADEAPMEVLESLGGLQRQEVAQIERALQRIEEGTYGKCARCGEEISDARLRAIPHTICCVKCQRGVES